MHGNLEVVTGPMFGGKTTETLRSYLWLTIGLKRKALALKPRFDTRYSETEIVSHIGIRAPAVSIDRFPWNHLTDDVRAVYLDEVHFLEAPLFDGDIVADIRKVLATGRDVHAAGLDMDVNGRSFAVTAALLAMADRVTKVRAICSICGRDASKTQKIGGTSSRFELGASDKYEARCNEHWSLIEATGVHLDFGDPK